MDLQQVMKVIQKNQKISTEAQEFKRNDWERTLKLKDGGIIVWADSGKPYPMRYIDLLADDWNLLPSEQKARTVEELHDEYEKRCMILPTPKKAFMAGAKAGIREGRIERNHEYKPMIQLLAKLVYDDNADDNYFLQKARAFEVDIWHEWKNLPPTIKD